MKRTTKKLCALIAAVMIISVILPVISSAKTVTVQLGDANQDAKVNTADATCILKHCADIQKITDIIALTAADVTQDNAVNTADATAVLRGIAYNEQFGTVEMEVPDASEQPTAEPSEEPSTTPSEEPTTTPSEEPTTTPSEEPTATPSEEPTTTPSEEPTATPEPNEPVEINNASDFMAIGNDLSADYSLNCDIDFGGAVIAPLGKISQNSGTPFTGTFDGNGHTLSNFTFPVATYMGLFFDNQGTITDLYISNVNLTSAGSFGIIACQNSIGGKIVKCGVSGNVKIKSDRNYWYTGGIAGYNMGTIDQCWSNVNITGTMGQYYIGDIAGYASGTISNCFAFGSITGVRGAGIVGYIDAGTIENCYSMCKLNDVDSNDNNWIKHAWGECGKSLTVKGFFYQRGLYYKNGVLKTTWDTEADPNGNWGCSLKTDEWIESRFTDNGWSTDIWDFSGSYPTLKNCPVTDGISVQPPVEPKY